MDKIFSKSTIIKDVMEGFDSTLIIFPYDDKITNSPAYKIANPAKSATFATQKPKVENLDLEKALRQKAMQLSSSQKNKAQYQTGLVFRAFRELYQRVRNLEDSGHDASLEVSAFQIIDNKIVDLGMPDDAKKNNTIEIRNLDFEKYDMDTYEDMKGTVFVKNCYYKDITCLDDFKYFIDKWLKAQGNTSDKNKSKQNQFSSKNDSSNAIPDDLKEEINFGHTIFSILVKRKVTMARLYIVACSPYQNDVNFYEESKAPIYTGTRSSNEALNKLSEICQIVQNGQDLDDHTKFPFND